MRSRRASLSACAGLALLPVLANAPALGGWLDASPIYVTSGLIERWRGGPLDGLPGWVDPNAGLTMQALGRLAADQWLAGRVPWWNPYSGVGLPLAAEMQPAALFLPFILLMRFAQGLLLTKVALQAVAGLATWGLLRALGLTRFAALLGGALFEMNGTFAFYGDGPVYPVAFLPLLLLGVLARPCVDPARRPPTTGPAAQCYPEAVSESRHPRIMHGRTAPVIVGDDRPPPLNPQRSVLDALRPPAPC